MTDYDVIVIGAGPGGYVAAIRCAQLGFKTACVEAWRTPQDKPALGGTCLNVGCIPSKALLDSSHHFEFIREHAGAHGIRAGDASIDVARMMARKDDVVARLTQGVAGLFKKHRIDWLQGHGRLSAPLEVSVTPADKNAETTTHRGRYVIIASGSVPATIQPAPVDQDRICDSTGALGFTEVPARLGVIGAGVIGLELGSVWRRLGSEVIVLEALAEFLPAADRDIAGEALKLLSRQGLDIRLGAKVTAAKATKSQVRVTAEIDGESNEMKFDRLVVAVGRRPATADIGAEAVGLTLDARGFIEVDENCCTNLDNVYAIGDCVHGPMLAHKASEEGIAVAERIAGQQPIVDHGLVPWVIYTWPEIAWVGQTEQSLSNTGREIRTGRFPFLANGRALAAAESSGFVKIIADAHTDEVLGVHIIGANASELIAEAVSTMAFSGSSEDLARTVHAHPTLAEAIHEAALAVDKRPIHI